MDFDFTPEEEAFRAELRAFLDDELPAWWKTVFVDDERAMPFTREFCHQLAERGWLTLSWPAEHGGADGSVWQQAVVREEMWAAGEPRGPQYMNLNYIGPLIMRFGTPEQQARHLPRMAAGDVLWCQGFSEPEAGSDLASLKTRAVRDGDHYVVNGEKTFITSGMRADFLTVAVRTDPANQGPGGVSLLVIDGDTPGLTRHELKKMGWWCSDTAYLRFDRCRVPVANRVGAEGEGFKAIMHNFNSERLMMAAMACSYGQACAEEALAWARERRTFGAPLAERQVIRHKLVDMVARIEAARALVYDLAHRVQHGLGSRADLVARTCMAKVVATQAMQFCADQAVQILGGMGFMRGTKSERLYREAKVMMIGGGSEEIMKDLAARQLGI